MLIKRITENKLIVSLAAIALIMILILIVNMFQNKGEINLFGSYSETLNDGSYITVHVKGEVLNPGVYTLKEGDRITDAIDAAGGALPEAEINLLNLAAKIKDEQEILVPKMAQGDADNQPEKININTAGSKILCTLSGIGEKTAEKIIDYREGSGRFTSIEQLKTLKIVSSKVFEDIKDKITVK